MKQALHLFRKDIRQHWIETLISLAIVVAAAWTDRYLRVDSPADSMPFTWRLVHEPLKPLATVFVVLMPISWWLLIERVVHAETLIGDKQFWITRPIDWTSLLGAKALFLLTFLYLPFGIAMSVELHRAGFPVAPAIPGLLFLLILITGIFVVPLLALAVVTRNFVRMLFTLLGVFLAIGGLAWLGEKIDAESVSTPYSDRFSIPVLLLVAGAAIVLQYARRKTWLARTLLLSLPFFLASFAIFLPNRSFVESAYPRLDRLSTEPIHLSLAADPSIRGGSNDDQLELVFPILAEGAAAGHAVLPDDILSSVDNDAWDSHWQAVYNHNVLPGRYRSEFVVHVKKQDYERLRTSPHSLTLRFALTEVRGDRDTIVHHPEKEFSVPGFGICSPTPRNPYFQDDRSIPCRSALHGPDLTFIGTTGSIAACDAQPGSDAPIGDWQGSLNNDPADFGLISVWKQTIFLKNLSTQKDVSRCLDRPLVFTHYSLVRRNQTEMDIPNFHFPDLPAAGEKLLIVKPSGLRK